MPIYAIDDLIPVIKSNTYIHPSAEIIGDVIIEEHCYIGPNAVLRGDFGPDLRRPPQQRTRQLCAAQLP